MNKMKAISKVRFPNGFILSSTRLDPPAGFLPGPILSNFYAKPETELHSAGDKNLFVIIIGQCIPISEEHSLPPVEALLERLRRGEQLFFEELGYYGGRHAVIFGAADDVRVVNDATAMRSVFYSLEQGTIVASHATLVETALGATNQQDDLIFGYGFPGNRTPFARTRILTANTWLSFSAGSVRRFWPNRVPPPRSVDEVATDILEAATTTMRNVAHDRLVKIALTAGIDSRAVLAVAMHSGINYETYTYGAAKNTALDRSFAADFAKRLEIPHSLVRRLATPPELREVLAEAHYSPHHQGEVAGLINFFADQRALAVSGNLLEIGRSFYKNYTEQAPPVTAEAMSSLHLQSMSKKLQSKIADYGNEHFHAKATIAFQAFIDESEYTKSRGMLDPFDQFYWEHRMSTWHGPAMLERDFYATAFIPFNSRRIFEAMLGLSLDERKKAEVFYRLIEIANPRLLDFPINPAQWPQSSS